MACKRSAVRSRLAPPILSTSFTPLYLPAINLRTADRVVDLGGPACAARIIPPSSTKYPSTPGFPYLLNALLLNALFANRRPCQRPGRAHLRAPAHPACFCHTGLKILYKKTPMGWTPPHLYIGINVPECSFAKKIIQMRRSPK